MPKLVKAIESDEKYLSLCSHLKFKYFDLCEIFLQWSHSDFFLKSRGIVTAIKNYKMALFTAWSGQEKKDISIILKTKLSGCGLVFVCDSFLLHWKRRLISRWRNFSPKKMATGKGERSQWKTGLRWRNFTLKKNGVSEMSKWKSGLFLSRY